jgi:hypothetical protein
MSQKREHKHFGLCECGDLRTTTGGHQVMDSTCADRYERTLLVDKVYWGKKEEKQ